MLGWLTNRMVGSREGCEGFQTLCGAKKKSQTKKGTYSPVAVTVSTLMSHRRSLTKTVVRGLGWRLFFSCQSRRILAPIEPTKLLMASTVLCLDGPVWQSPSPASWGDCSADRKRVLSTVDFCGDFVSVFVSSFPADRVLRRPSETLKHLDLPHRSREMVVRCCDHLQTHSESLALKLWPCSNSPGVWELFGSGDVLHPRILEFYCIPTIPNKFLKMELLLGRVRTWILYISFTKVNANGFGWCTFLSNSTSHPWKLWQVVRFCCKDGFVREEEFLKTMVHAIAVEAINRSLALNMWWVSPWLGKTIQFNKQPLDGFENRIYMSASLFRWDTCSSSTGWKHGSLGGCAAFLSCYCIQTGLVVICCMILHEAEPCQTASQRGTLCRWFPPGGQKCWDIIQMTSFGANMC